METTPHPTDLSFILSFICDYLDKDCAYDPADHLTYYTCLVFTYKCLTEI